MEIIKWYSIILLSIGALSYLWECIRDRDFTKFLSLILSLPIIIYLIIK